MPDRSLPWPEEYHALEAPLRNAWSIKDLYLNRVLSGKSGALVYAVDVTAADFTGQAILKLAELGDLRGDEADEATRHLLAVDANPDYAARHLPTVVHSFEHEQQLAVLSTIAARGLQYSNPWAHCSYDVQLSSGIDLAAELLESWNSGYRIADGIAAPTELLSSWLGYRLDPDEGGRIHSFLENECSLDPEEPTLLFEGHWYPNPLSFARSVQPDELALRAVIGNVHGDLHGYNILVASSKAPGAAYYLIDLAFYQPNAFLLFDHAYLEVSHLLQTRDQTSLDQWLGLIDALTRDAQPAADDLGIVQLLTAMRGEVSAWVERHEPNRLSYLESQFMLARVAVGLTFSHRRMSVESRLKCFLYAAANLKHYLKFHNVNWPKYGQVLVVSQDVEMSIDVRGRGVRRSLVALGAERRKTGDARSHNLPVQLTSFVGRGQELTEAEALLRQSVLLTLTGVGGSGKTRLALQIASSVLDEHPDGVWLVRLASLSDPELVPKAVADVLGIREQPHRPLTDTVAEVLHDRTALLVLDNCEHVRHACARFVTSLLETSAGLRVLATSREVLGAPGEVVYDVPSLALPDPENLHARHSLAGYDSVRLFVERAESVVPEFQVDDDNIDAVVEICRRLDGMPLAIELAAARLRVLSPSELAARLDDRFRLLTGGSATALPRQQTLRAAVDWSYELLSDKQRMLFNRLSVFSGGFTIDAAEVVCGNGGLESSDILDLLHQLVNQSMLAAERHRATETRYRLLETLREYAQDKMAEAGETDEVRRRHADHFLALAEKAESKLREPDQVEWLQRLETDHDNLRRALRWSSETGQTETYLRLTASLLGFWHSFGHWNEGRRWLDTALAHDPGALPEVKARILLGAVEILVPEDPKRAVRFATEALELAKEMENQELVARSLLLSGFTVLDRRERANSMLEQALHLYRELGDRRGIGDSLSLLASANAVAKPEQAMTWVSESLKLFRQLDDPTGTAEALGVGANIAWSQGDYGKAVLWLEESLAISQELGGKELGAHKLRNLGDIALLQEDYERATLQLEESLHLFRQVGDRHCAARALKSLGVVALRKGLAQEATASIREALRTSHEVKDRRNVVLSLEGLAEAAQMNGTLRKAARLYGAAESIREARGMQLIPTESSKRELAIATVRGELEKEAFVKEWSSGRALSLDDAVDYALAQTDE